MLQTCLLRGTPKVRWNNNNNNNNNKNPLLQLGTLSVNGEWVCGGLFADSCEILTNRSRTRSAESARPLRVILDSVGYH